MVPVLRRPSSDWASSSEERPPHPLPGTLGKPGWWQHGLEGIRGKKIRIHIRIHRLIPGPGGGGGSSPLPSRDQALPFGPQEAIVLQPHTSPRYGVSSHTRTFTNLTLPSLTFPNSTALLWTLTCIPLFPFCWV